MKDEYAVNETYKEYTLCLGTIVHIIDETAFDFKRISCFKYKFCVYGRDTSITTLKPRRHVVLIYIYSKAMSQVMKYVRNLQFNFFFRVLILVYN